MCVCLHKQSGRIVREKTSGWYIKKRWKKTPESKFKIDRNVDIDTLDDEVGWNELISKNSHTHIVDVSFEDGFFSFNFVWCIQPQLIIILLNNFVFVSFHAVWTHDEVSNISSTMDIRIYSNGMCGFFLLWCCAAKSASLVLSFWPVVFVFVCGFSHLILGIFDAIEIKWMLLFAVMWLVNLFVGWNWNNYFR